jgi:hypothetical protein
MIGQHPLIQQADGPSRFAELCGIDKKDGVRLGQEGGQPKPQRPPVHWAKAWRPIGITRKSAHHMHADAVILQQDIP